MDICHFKGQRFYLATTLFVILIISVLAEIITVNRWPPLEWPKRKDVTVTNFQTDMKNRFYKLTLASIHRLRNHLPLVRRFSSYVSCKR